MGILESVGEASVTSVFFRALSLLPPLRDWTQEIDDALFRDPYRVFDWFLFARKNSKQSNIQSGHSTDLCTVTCGLRIHCVNK